MITKERLLSFPLEKQFLIAASDFIRAANLLRKNHKDLTLVSINEGLHLLSMLLEDNHSIAHLFPSKEEILNMINTNNERGLYDIYVTLMGLGGIDRVKLLNTEKRYL